jgi:hypothetical protein
LCDRIRALLAGLMQAKAWHNAVLANSPLAYKSFYDKFSDSPYAQNALKLVEQPKVIPLSQPTHIIAPPSIKLGGLGMSKDNPGLKLGAPGLLQGGATAQPGNILQGVGKGGMDKLGNGDHIVTLPPTGTAASSGNNGVGKIVTLPSSGPTASSGHNGVGKIVTLPPSGASSGNNGTGKVIDLPGGRLNKTGVSQDSKFNGVVTRFDDRSAKPLPHIDQQRRLDQQPAAKPRMNFGPSPTRQGLGNTNAGSDLHVASGPAMQSQARSNGKLMRW